MQFFGQFLIQKKMISAVQLREALAVMAKKNLRMGEIAVSMGLLTESQANDVNREQRYTDKPFGAIAVNKGLLTDEQVKDLLARQHASRLRIGEALLDLGHIDEPSLNGALTEFHSTEETVAISDIRLPGKLEGNRIARFILELFARTLQRLTPVRAKVPASFQEVGRLQTDVMASILMRHEEGVRVGIACNQEFAIQLLHGVLGHEPSPEQLEGEGILDDATAEFLNIVCGAALAGLEQEGILADLDPPILGIPMLNGYAFELVTTAADAKLLYAAP